MVDLRSMVGLVSYMDMDVSVAVAYRVKCSVTIGVRTSLIVSTLR